MTVRVVGGGDVAITITVGAPLITFKSAAWGAPQKQSYLESQEGIRAAVQQSQYREVLKEWLEKRVKLSIEVEFHLKAARATQADLDSMLGDLFNPLVEGAVVLALHTSPFHRRKTHSSGSATWPNTSAQRQTKGPLSGFAPWNSRDTTLNASLRLKLPLEEPLRLLFALS